MDVYYEPIATDDELTRESVAEETDVARLRGWLAEQQGIESELRTMIGTLQPVDPDSTVRMARKLGYVRISSNWIRQRLHELGEEVPDTVGGAKMRRIKHQLTMVNQALEQKNKTLKELRRENEALIAKLAQFRERADV